MIEERALLVDSGAYTPDDRIIQELDTKIQALGGTLPNVHHSA